jgi:hypothetical protein
VIYCWKRRSLRHWVAQPVWLCREATRCFIMCVQLKTSVANFKAGSGFEPQRTLRSHSYFEEHFSEASVLSVAKSIGLIEE